MSKTFIAFGGPIIEQQEARFVIEEGYECWNLSRFTFEKFIDEIRTVIPPSKNTTLDSYWRGFLQREDMSKIFSEAKWGLLLPTDEKIGRENQVETMQLLNLFSPEFLYPLFTASDFGLENYFMYPYIEKRNWFGVQWLQNQSMIFKTKQFASFHKELLGMIYLLQWVLDRVQTWNNLEFRIWWANRLFDDLKKYHNSKDTLADREYVDICVILESLLMKNKNDSKLEIEAKLKRRISVLLKHQFQDICGDIDLLYDKRSRFIHGETYMSFKPTEEHYHTMPDFIFSRKCTAQVRFLIIAYMYVVKRRKEDPKILPEGDIITILEEASADSSIGKTLEELANEILKLVPNPN